jgi:hypothetical protein
MFFSYNIMNEKDLPEQGKTTGQALPYAVSFFLFRTVSLKNRVLR